MSDLEQEYSPSSRVGGSAEPFIADYVARSSEALRGLAGREQRLGDGSLVVAEPGAGTLLVFVHGGYWQALSARDSAYLAPGALAAGCSFAALEYTIAPEGTVARMVEECRRALAAVASVVPHDRLVLAGHSAGAHLAAMVAAASEPPVPVLGLVLLSGVFDLRPLVHTSVNDPLDLDAGAAESLSPLLLPVKSTPATFVAVGEVETDAFHMQSHLMAARLRVAGAVVSELVVPERHHFDIVDDLVDPSSAIGAFVRHQGAPR